MRRWQFSLGTLFSLTFVMAVASASVAGAFGAPVQRFVTSTAVVTLVVLAGMIYYALAVAVLLSPILLAAWLLRLVSRAQKKPRDGDQAG